MQRRDLIATSSNDACIAIERLAIWLDAVGRVNAEGVGARSLDVRNWLGRQVLPKVQKKEVPRRSSSILTEVVAFSVTAGDWSSVAVPLRTRTSCA